MLSPTQALSQGFELEDPVQPLAVASHAANDGLIAGAQQRQGFRVGGLNLMIRYQDGDELTDMPPLHRVPNAPVWFAGMTNLHGTLVPVFDLARWMGTESGARAKPMLLVIGHAGDATGIIIDGLPQRLRWSARDVVSADTVPPALAAVVQRAVLIDDNLYFDLDCEPLFQALERSLGGAS